MRIWDVHPGYLNRQSLLGEHRELHGIVFIIIHGKKGYAKHPETIRWAQYGWALKMRHRQLACEMALRGYADKSPVDTLMNEGKWPEHYIDPPAEQLALLKEKCRDKETGRIPIPNDLQQLWSQHKYSVLARNPGLYQRIGSEVSRMAIGFSNLCMLLTETLREQPTEGGLRNAIQHMWGYVSDRLPDNRSAVCGWPLRKILSETQRLAIENKVFYLTCSTALSELMVWLP